ncbi:hypothetical protein FHS48_000129 [Novispirillum itersonii]|uniref:Uncharacterized protein n=1 Tax=Novispirillum itersonii TaxID=189 RepID=A0A7W9ZC43_NOVIT|nr:hypothetical protein [Novispirillum itersonii]MBB6208748.1 hypothetical protein [Novispirillum itersonii]
MMLELRISPASTAVHLRGDLRHHPQHLNRLFPAGLGLLTGADGAAVGLLGTDHVGGGCPVQGGQGAAQTGGAQMHPGRGPVGQAIQNQALHHLVPAGVQPDLRL